MNIGPYSYEEYLRLVKAFHGRLDPGLMIGGFMVDLALKNLPEGEVFGAISETPVCLPDAIQLLTSCTIGNGRLTVLDLGRFAAILYERDTGQGVRVFLDPAGLDEWPAIEDWFLKRKRYHEIDHQVLIREIKEAGHRTMGIGYIHVEPSRLRRRRIGPVALCPDCGEAYPAQDGIRCRGCQAGKHPEGSNGTIRNVSSWS